MIAAPPLSGADQSTVAAWSLRMATGLMGAFGTVAGVTAAVGAEGADVPTTLTAVTVNVYGVPLISPDTVQVVNDVVQVFAPGDEVTL